MVPSPLLGSTFLDLPRSCPELRSRAGPLELGPVSRTCDFLFLLSEFCPRMKCPLTLRIHSSK